MATPVEEEKPRPTGRVPTRFVESTNERADVTAVAGGSKQGPVGGPGAAMPEGHEGGEWRVGGQRGKGKGKSGGAGGGKSRSGYTDAAGLQEEDKEKQGDEPSKGGEETKLPPMRSFERPTVPREALAQRLQVQEARAEQLREEGAEGKKLERAEKKKQDVQQQLQMAGGRTSQSLGLQIRREEGNKKKAFEAMQRAQGRIDEREAQILELRRQITTEEELQERHRQRGQVAESRLAWLAMQKAKESLPNDFLARIRAASAAVARCTDTELEPVKELISVLTACPQVVALDSSGSSDGSEVWEGSEATLVGAEDRDALLEFEDEAQQEIAQARERLASVQKVYNEALENSFQRRPRAAKRAFGEEDPKLVDEAMASEEVEVLDPERVADMFRGKLKEEQAKVVRLESLASREKVPVCVQAPEKMQKSPGRQKLDEEERQLREEVEHKTQANLEIVMQERMQRQQEEELSGIAKMAIVRREAARFAARRMRATPH